MKYNTTHFALFPSLSPVSLTELKSLRDYVVKQTILFSMLKTQIPSWVDDRVFDWKSSMCDWELEEV